MERKEKEKMSYIPIAFVFEWPNHFSKASFAFICCFGVVKYNDC
jgi:hypothetical protein